MSSRDNRGRQPVTTSRSKGQTRESQEKNQGIRQSQTMQNQPIQEDQEEETISIPVSTRQNEYFVPRDGIDREVITADICRYLGKDALVRPGTYEHDDGRLTQGYFITAYRNLTSAMIQDLKADSTRWEQERRTARNAQAAATGGGTHPKSLAFGLNQKSQDLAESQQGINANRNPDYHGSETHRNRQYFGPTGADPSAGDAMAIDTNYGGASAVRYPGSGAAGYNGVNSAGGGPFGYPQQQFNPQGYGAFPGSGHPAQFSPAQTDRYGNQGMSGFPQPYGGHQGMMSDPAFGHGANMNAAMGGGGGGPNPYVDYSRMQGSSANAMPSMYTTAPTRQGYPPDPTAYYHQAMGPQPMDAFYGRGVGTYNQSATTAPPTSGAEYVGSPAHSQAQTGYPMSSEMDYEEEPRPPSHPQVTGPAPPPQPTGNTTKHSSRRERTTDQDRDTDRHSTEKHDRRRRERQ